MVKDWTGKFPNNMGKLVIRCSNPAGCPGLRDANYYHVGVRCACRHPFWIAQRYLLFWPGDNTNMAAVINNERSRMGWNTVKIAAYDRNNVLKWQNTQPTPADNITYKASPKGFMHPQQAEAFTMEETKGWIHRALVDRNFSNKQDFKFEVDTTHWTEGPPNTKEGDRNPHFGNLYTPLIGDRDHDGSISVFKQGGPEALYGITNPIPILIKTDPMIRFMMNAQGRGSPHNDALRAQPEHPGPFHTDGHAFVTSPGGIHIPGFKAIEVPSEATLPGLTGGLIGAHTTILKDLDNFQEQIKHLLQEAGMHAGAYAQPYPLRDALRSPETAPKEWHGIETLPLAQLFDYCFEAEKEVANVMTKRAAQEVTIEYLILIIQLLRQNIQADSATATLTYKQMEQTIQTFAQDVKAHQGKGLHALHKLIRHFKPVMTAYEATALREPPPYEGPPGQIRMIIGNVPYDSPQQGFAGIDAIPHLLFSQTTDMPVDMAVDTEGRTAAKRGSAGDDSGTPPIITGGDGGWNIFRSTTPLLMHDGAKVTPARYNLHLHYQDSPAGAANRLEAILRECDPALQDTKEDKQEEDSPRKKQRDSNSPPTITNSTNAAGSGAFALVEPPSVINIQDL